MTWPKCSRVCGQIWETWNWLPRPWLGQFKKLLKCSDTLSENCPWCPKLPASLAIAATTTLQIHLRQKGAMTMTNAQSQSINRIHNRPETPALEGGGGGHFQGGAAASSALLPPNKMRVQDGDELRTVVVASSSSERGRISGSQDDHLLGDYALHVLHLLRDLRAYQLHHLHGTCNHLGDCHGLRHASQHHFLRRRHCHSSLDRLSRRNDMAYLSTIWWRRVKTIGKVIKSVDKKDTCNIAPCQKKTYWPQIVVWNHKLLVLLRLTIWDEPDDNKLPTTLW